MVIWEEIDNMYVPIWLLVIGLIAYWIFKKHPEINSSADFNNVKDIENYVSLEKDRLYNLEHFDSPHFIDLLNDYDVMNVNYIRLKERYAHDKEKSLQIAKDWVKYVDALGDLKLARTILDLGEVDDFYESSKEPTIIKEEVEKRFKTMLGKEWQKLMPDFFERKEKANEAMKKEAERFDVSNGWRVFYQGDNNLEKMESLRKEKKEEEHAK